MQLGRELAARPGPAEQIPIADASHGLSIRLRVSPRFAPPRPRSPVRVCFRYISNHSNFLDYKGALAAGLPIGSGEIESGHRYVFQNRLNIAGGLVEDGKPKEDDRSTGLAGEPRLGRLLEQRASESGITDSHF